jgi:UDP-N-acetylmuramoylalanine--D-glutamate ligase
LEAAGDVGGVRFVNDSKATNTEAAEFGLGSFMEPLVWVVGGVDKGNDYGLLFEIARKNVKAIVCLGKDNQKILSAFAGLGVPMEEAFSAEEAVKTAFALAAPGDVVLLSPACASFDLFKNYEHRGDAFKAAVKALSLDKAAAMKL